MVNEGERPAMPDEREDRDMIHVHTYYTISDVAEQHQHMVMGASAPARMDGRTHIHRLRIRTSFNDGHWHWFDVVSGPMLEMPGGSHTHYYCGNTSMNEDHCHRVEGMLDVILDEEYDEEYDCNDKPDPPGHGKYKKKRLE